jgi:hypothetical protein
VLFVECPLVRQRKSNKKKGDFFLQRCATAKAKAARGPRKKKWLYAVISQLSPAAWRLVFCLSFTSI